MIKPFLVIVYLFDFCYNSIQQLNALVFWEVKLMTVEGVKDALNAKLIIGEGLLGQEVSAACGADMMSDVLAYVKDQAVLLTGLCNSQVIRTAEMMDIICVIFVRGKQPNEEMIRLAKTRGIVLLKTEYTMFSACGILHGKGLCGGDKNDG